MDKEEVYDLWADPAHEIRLKRMEATFDQIIAEGPEACKNFLKRAGIMDENGNLSEHYRL